MRLSFPAVLVAWALLATSTTVPAFAQAAGSADASAAKRVNPNWKAPRNALGSSRSRRHLDHRRHEGCADVPAASVRHAPIPHRSGVRRTRQATQQCARHRRRQNGNLPQRRGLARVQLHVDGDRSARWPRTADDRGRARPSAPGRVIRRRPVELNPGLLALRPLHHARRDRLVHASRLRQWRAHHADTQRRGHHLRDDSRHARDPARCQAAARLEHPTLDGRCARPLGGRHAGGRVHELHRPDSGGRRAFTARRCS